MSINSLTDAAASALGNAVQPEPQQPAAESVSRFEELMQQPLAQPAGEAQHTFGSQIVEAVERQDGQMRTALENVENLSAHVATLSPIEQIGASGQVAVQLSLAQFDFQTRMAVVQSTKSSAETLMKNQ
ncbi:MAG TPA: type III secretion protein [Paraburkholderia sp.]|jgi:type III secretion inner rod protein HrpB2|nr:type III secretion protein [Paraburkholderia sp.]